MKEYTNSQICGLIDEHVHSARDRDILKLRFIDGYKYDAISEKILELHKIPISPRQISTIISNHAARLERFL